MNWPDILSRSMEFYFTSMAFGMKNILQGGPGVPESSIYSYSEKDILPQFIQQIIGVLQG